jgi:hypothetical protein
LTAPPFTIVLTQEADGILADLEGTPAHAVKLKKVRRTIGLLETQGPGYPGLNTHLYQSIAGPGGEKVWECYVENRTPSAWRLWFIYGPAADMLTVLTIGPHP